MGKFNCLVWISDSLGQLKLPRIPNITLLYSIKLDKSSVHNLQKRGVLLHDDWLVDLFLDPNHEKGPSCHHRSLSVTFFVRALFRDTKSPFSVSALLYRVLASLHHYINLATHVREGKSLTAAMQLRLETEGNRPRAKGGFWVWAAAAADFTTEQPRCQGFV